MHMYKYIRILEISLSYIYDEGAEDKGNHFFNYTKLVDYNLGPVCPMW